MTVLTKNGVKKEARYLARKAGLILKEQATRINGDQAYRIINRKTGRVYMSNMSLDMAYQNLLSGYAQSLNPENR